MDEPDIAQVQQRLTAVISKERRESVGYAALTVLCTPVFALLASVVALLILCYVLRFADYDVDAIGIYTGINLFLAWMVTFVLRLANPPEDPHEFDRTWLAGVGVFLFLIVLTYATSLLETKPVLFGVVYAVLGFLVLGLLGHAQMNKPLTDDTGQENPFLAFILAVSGFIAMSFGEVTQGSWLWIPPDDDEIRLAAWVLCKLAAERDGAVARQSLPLSTLRLLSRLKLVKVAERTIVITLKGLDLASPVNESQYIVKE